MIEAEKIRQRKAVVFPMKTKSWIMRKQGVAGAVLLAVMLSLLPISGRTAAASPELDLLQVSAWDQLAGGSEVDYFHSVIETSDGGYVAAGLTYSGPSGELTDPSNGSVDGLLMKFDALGQPLWNQVFGGSGMDEFSSVAEDAQGNLIVAGKSTSSATGEITDTSNGLNDGLLVKFDAHGQPLWSQLFGSSDHEYFYSAVPLSDGGYVAVGSAKSYATNGEITEQGNGSDDGLLVKFDADGKAQWHHLYGGTEGDAFVDVVALADGGFAAAGLSSSSASGELTDSGNGGSDGWLVRFDGMGNPVWDQLFGGTSTDRFYSVAPTDDGGFIAAGYTRSLASGELTDTNNGYFDGLLVRFDPAGQPLWDQVFGGTGFEEFREVIQTPDGGFIAAGNTASGPSGEITDPSNGGDEGLVVRLDPSGRPLWDQLYGGWRRDVFYSIAATSDGKFVAAGLSDSITGEFTDQPNGGYDGILVKFTTGYAPSITLQPEPAVSRQDESATFHAEASGTPRPNAQWQISEDHGVTWNDQGLYGSPITVTSIYPEIDQLICCKFTNSLGVAYSDAVQWRVIPKPNLQVISGETRFETAVALTMDDMWDNTAILVQSHNFPDALAAGPLAYALNAPIFLTETDALNPTTQSALANFRFQHILIMGGELAIGSHVEETLLQAGHQIRRIAGATRYETAVEAAQTLAQLQGSPESVFLVSGTQFPDALSIGSQAARSATPLLLTDGKTMPAVNQAFLEQHGIRQLTMVGGTIPLSQALETSLIQQGHQVLRIAGENRQATSALVARTFFPGAEVAVVASGRTFPDALAATPYAAKRNAPLLLVERDAAGASIIDYLNDAPIHSIRVVGGELAISSACRDQLLAAIQ